MNRAELKKDAKEKLKGNYITSGVIVLLYFIICIVEDLLYYGVPVLGLFLSYGLLSLFAFGFKKSFLKISRGEKACVSDLGSCTEMMLKYFLLLFLTSLFSGLWTLLLIVPGIIVFYSYRLVYYITLDNPEISTMGAIRLSKELMNGHKRELFILDCSFILWHIASIVTLGLLYLYVIPYSAVTKANFYNKIIDEYLKEIED